MNNFNPLIVKTPTKSTFWQFIIGKTKFYRLELEYYNEMKNRNYEESAWEKYIYEIKIRYFLESLLREYFWFKRSKADPEIMFHPNDPYFIVGGFQTGDLSEIEILMKLEDKYNISLEEIKNQLYNKIDLIGLINFIENRICNKS